MTQPLGGFTQIPVGPVPVQACPPLGQGQSVMFYNQDVNNIVTVAPQSNITQDATNGAPIQPLTSAVLPASKALWAVAPAGTAPLVIVPEGGTLSPSPAQIAAQISALGLATLAEQINQNTAIPDNVSTTGVPLLNLSNPITSGAGVVIPGGGTAGGFVGPINQPAYDVGFEVEIAAGATVPWLEVEFTWLDNTGLVAISSETFYLGCTSSGVNVYNGRGQTKGDTFEFQMVNLDPAKSITVTYSILQNSRIPPRTDWRTQAFNGITGFTTPGNDPTSGQILQYSNPITNGTTVSLAVPLYTGKVKLAVAETGQTGRILVRNQAVSGLIGSTPFIFDSGPIAANGGFDGDISLPNAACRLDVSNTGSASATFTASLVAEEY